VARADRRSSGLFRAFAVVAFLVASCTSLPPPAPSDGRSYRGRFSLAIDRAQGGDESVRKAYAGRFTLQLAGPSLTLDLISPLGATIARFESAPHEARLLIPSGEGVQVKRGSDMQALCEQELGWSLPLSGLPDWIEGRPAANRPFRMLAEQSGAWRFEQDGWSVDVAPASAGARRLQIDRAERPDAPGVALRVLVDGPAS